MATATPPETAKANPDPMGPVRGIGCGLVIGAAFWAAVAAAWAIFF